jgi:transcriptional regulator with XRE-family HTH domain
MIYSNPDKKGVITMSIAQRLKEARLARKMTQEDLAKAVGVTKGAIGNYETGVSSPKESILIKLMEILQIDANFLYQDFIQASGKSEDEARLEALHQDPRLGVLFDRIRRMPHDDVETMLAVTASILKERNGE